MSALARDPSRQHLPRVNGTRKATKKKRVVKKKKKAGDSNAASAAEEVDETPPRREDYVHQNTCPGGHELTGGLVREGEKFGCHDCHVNITFGSLTFFCESCGYDLCYRCNLSRFDKCYGCSTEVRMNNCGEIMINVGPNGSRRLSSPLPSPDLKSISAPTPRHPPKRDDDMLDELDP